MNTIVAVWEAFDAAVQGGGVASIWHAYTGPARSVSAKAGPNVLDSPASDEGRFNTYPRPVPARNLSTRGPRARGACSFGKCV